MAAVNARRRGTRAHPVSDENAVPSLTAARTARTVTAAAKDNTVGLRPRATSSGPAAKPVLGEVKATTAGRKRTALGPVTNAGGGSKLSEVKEEGPEELKPAKPTMLKPSTTATRTTVLARQRAQSTATTSAGRPLSNEPTHPSAIRPPTRRTRSGTVIAPPSAAEQAQMVSDIPEETQEDEEDEDAMEIDPPEPGHRIVRPQVPRRTSTRLSSAVSTSIPTTSKPASTAARQPLRARTTTITASTCASTSAAATTTGTTRLIAGNAAVRKSKVLVAPRPVAPPQPAAEDDEQDEGAPIKKRRTSSMDADEHDALQPRHPRARVVESLVATKREVKRKTTHAEASGSTTTLVIKEEVQKTVEVIEEESVVQDWIDLDEQDAGDPMMVTEYADEIYEYLLRCELKNMPNPNYMDTQKELTWKFRDVLVDWLVQVHGSFRMLPETLFLCINIVDRFLSVRVVSLVKFQLVGVAALYLSAKFEEQHYPTVADLVKCCDSGYDDRSVLQAEAYILKSIGFDLSYPGPMSFLRRVSKADDYDVQSRTLAKYFLEMASLDWHLIAVPPSLASAASIWLARRIMRRGGWHRTLVHYAGYEEEEIVPVAHKMVCYVLRDRAEPQHEHFSKKYSRKLYNKARQFIQDWAKGLNMMTLPQFQVWVKSNARRAT